MSKLSTLGTNAVLSLFLVTGLGAGCAGDDAKLVAEAGGAGGEAGESNHSGGSSDGGGSGNDGGTLAGFGGDGSGASAGSSGTSAGGDGGGGGSTSVGGGEGGEAGTTPLGGSAGEAEGGAAGAPVEVPTPVPLACIGCASDSCVQARVACQADATCVACRDEDYSAPGCAQNVAFTNWVACICATGCAAACSSVCGT